MMTKVELVGLDTLAEKLGTTAEYLWAVLLKQAPIYAATTTAELLLVGIGVYLYIKFFKRFCDWFEDEIAQGFVVGACTVTVIVICVVGISCLSAIVSALLNPEYWALKQVLSAVAGKR